jgi:phosphohistidine phosphatase SixA
MRSVSRSLPCLVAAVCLLSLGTARADAPTGGQATAPAAPMAPPAEASVKTIIVVRHAEAEPTKPGGDPTLTNDGKTRALELARTLSDTPLHAVYTTHFQRGRMTAGQLPRRAGDKPTVIDDVPGTLRALRAEPWGATALVVGHSNTVPDLIRGLTGQPLGEAEPILFDRLWIVTMARDGSASLLRLHYGAPVPVPPPAPVTPGPK